VVWSTTTANRGKNRKARKQHSPPPPQQRITQTLFFLVRVLESARVILIKKNKISSVRSLTSFGMDHTPPLFLIYRGVNSATILYINYYKSYINLFFFFLFFVFLLIKGFRGNTTFIFTFKFLVLNTHINPPPLTTVRSAHTPMVSGPPTTMLRAP
jgi:hypothetical protein